MFAHPLLSVVRLADLSLRTNFSSDKETMNSDPPLILITNDDGIHAPGIKALTAALEPLGEVWVVAPDREQSAASHSVSLHRPLRVIENAPRRLMVDGTPVDSVMLATRYILPRRADLVVSGVNQGANLGDDVTYSGTVAGAREGMLLGLPAIAVSNIEYGPKHYDTAAQVAAHLAAIVLAKGLPQETLLNVNVPDLPYGELAGIEWTRMGRRHYEDEILKREDPRGNTYFWIGGSLPDEAAEPGTDVHAVEHKKVSVTPLRRDTTQGKSFEVLQDWNLTL